MIIIGFVAGVILTLLTLALVLPKIMFLESESKYGFDETNLLIEKRTSEMKWSMSHRYDLQATMKKHGLDVRPVMVFSLCKPDVAHKILGADAERIASAMMPCRVSVYQRNDGKTYVSRLNTHLFSRFLGKTIRGAMKEAARENELMLEPLIKSREPASKS